MYHVIGTGSTAILLYLISYILVKIGILPLLLHRKVWNYILAISFIATALAGIFMALQITYKWEIPFVKSVLKWHVEFGIGMSFTGLFHFIRHFLYFTKKSEKTEKEVLLPVNTPDTIANIGTNLFIVGLVSTAIQLLLIREMMNITGGYELITGTFLASWLICSAAGAIIAGKSSLYDIRRINLTFSLSPIVSIGLLLLLSRLFLNPGQTPSFLVSIIFTLLVLLPSCLVSGFSFVKLLTIARSEKGFVPGKSFSIETTGGIVSGLAISLLTAGLLNTYQLILLIIILTFSYVLFTFYIRSEKVKIKVRILILFLAATVIVLNPDTFFRQILLPGIRITDSEETPYGNITKGEYKGEKSTYYNQRLLTYNNDVIEREENIHYAMLQSDNPEKVILISGSLRSHLPELLKYPVKKITYIERDPALTRTEDLKDESLPAGLTISNSDAFRYIRTHDECADVIILLVPPPSTLQLNRYYTKEFFEIIKKRLNPEGVFMCSPGPGDNYLNNESLNLYSSVFNSLSGVFKNVLPLPGNRLYFIASDKDLSTSLCAIVAMKRIDNSYVSSDFLADDLIKKKSEDVMALMDHTVRQNSTLFPAASFHFQAYNLSKNINEKSVALIVLLILFVTPVMAVKRRDMIMYFTASALAGFEIIILLTLQMTIGNMYQLTGLIMAGLMAGLAVGAGSNAGILYSFSLRTESMLLALFYIITGFVYNYMPDFNSAVPVILFLLLLTFLPAMITGNIFRKLTSKSADLSISPAIYSADLTGSAFGFILITGFAIPALGIQVSLFLLSSMIFTGILFGTVDRK